MDKHLQSTWKQLQLMQYLHDEHFHADVSRMTQSHRVQHLALHIAKYGCRLSIAHGGRDYGLFQKILIDSLIVGVSLANVAKVDLSKKLPEVEADTLLEAGMAYSAIIGEHPMRDEPHNRRRNIVYHIVDVVSKLADLSEKWDHCEGDVRPRIQELIPQFIMVIVSGLQVYEIGNIETKYLDRILSVEQPDMFFRYKVEKVHLAKNNILMGYLDELAPKYGLAKVSP